MMYKVLSGLWRFVHELLKDFIACYTWVLFPFLFWLPSRLLNGEESQRDMAFLTIAALLALLLIVRRINGWIRGIERAQ